MSEEGRKVLRMLEEQGEKSRELFREQMELVGLDKHRQALDQDVLAKLDVLGAGVGLAVNLLKILPGQYLCSSVNVKVCSWWD